MMKGRYSRKQKYGWANNSNWNEEKGYWRIHSRRDMYAELMECESQEEFLEIAGEWLNREKNTESFDFIITNLCLSYQSQKRESKYPWTFRNGDRNYDHYDDFSTKKES